MVLTLTSTMGIGFWCIQLGQAEETTVTTLDPIIVTGSAHLTKLPSSTQSISILERERYTSLQPNRITSILQQVPGIHTDEMGGRGGVSSLYLRGADPNFTLIMLNGIPLNDSTNQRGGSVDLSTIPFDQITRVEIVRGPLSSFYGSEAMAGAINLITKTESVKPFIHVLGEGGRFDSGRALLKMGGTLGPIASSLSFSHSQNREQVEKDKFSLNSIGWNFSLNTHSNWHLRLTGQYSDSSVQVFPEGSGGPRLALLKRTEERNTREFLTGLTAALDTESQWQHQLFLSVSRRFQEISNPGILSTPTLFRLPPSKFNTLYHRFQSRLTETWTIDPQWTISLGGQVTHEQGQRKGKQDQSSFGGSSNAPLDFFRRRTFGGIFAELTTTWWSALTVNLGVRLDLSQDFESKVSPRIGISYQLFSTLKIRGGYGTGFKLPSLASLDDPLIGNPSLEPETSKGWDVGLHYHTADHEITASLEYFHNRFRHLIDLDPEQLNQGTFQLVNLDRATTQGLEFSVTISSIPRVSIQGSLTYLKTRLAESGTELRNRPKWRGSTGLTFHLLPSLTFRSQIAHRQFSSRLSNTNPDHTSGRLHKG